MRVFLPQNIASVKKNKILPYLANKKSCFIFLVRTVGPVFPKQVPQTNIGVLAMCRRVLLVCRCTAKTRAGCNATNLSGIVDLKDAIVAQNSL